MEDLKSWKDLKVGSLYFRPSISEKYRYYFILEIEYWEQLNTPDYILVKVLLKDGRIIMDNFHIADMNNWSEM